MLGISKAAAVHLAQFEKYLAEAGQDVVVRQPAARPATASNDVNKILGPRPTVIGDATGAEQTIRAVVTGPASVGGAMPNQSGPTQLASLGKVGSCDLVLRVLLSDALLDETRRHGKTYFDTAFDVLVDGIAFKVEATERSGLAPLGPYVLWVGLMTQGK